MSTSLGKHVTLTKPDDFGKLLEEDRKSTRLNSSHDQISYAVFCLKKKNAYTRAVRGRSLREESLVASGKETCGGRGCSTKTQHSVCTKAFMASRQAAIEVVFVTLS